jgi:hypothetical protein
MVASRQWSECDAVVVFLLLGVIWAAVLVPPWLQARREARPIASIMSFRSQLWSLQRATPNYGLDSYRSYGDEADENDLDSEDAEVHAFDLQRRAVPAAASAGSVAPGVIGAVVRPPSEGPGARPASALTVAAHQRRALAYRRRRRVLAALVLLGLAGVAPALLLGTPGIVAEAVAGTLLLAYVALLVRRGRREAERVQKVRYLSPIRAPRPAVVIIGSGAAR